ncbi:MAG: hypothetical protein Q9215_003421 [Flavoplaca cf. flavocitrina]
MSSIFTFDPDAQETLSSPWPVLVGEVRPPRSANREENVGDDHKPPATLLADYGIDSLDPEPQDGPMEYKLHLLLRPRRSFAALSTVQRVSGSHLSRSRLARLSNGGSSPVPKSPVPSASSSQSRESRLQNLTTQLLWRLQQSSPHHSASRSELVVPVLPGALAPPSEHRLPGKLIPGLGDSQGALYEIGVADDGTLVGLTVDELDESLAVLRAMAYSLGCEVRTLRRIIVGDCQWLEDVAVAAKVEQRLRMEKVWVAEAFVSPARAVDDSKTLLAEGSTDNGVSTSTKSHPVTCEATEKTSRTDQLRVSLTGSTTSGKSSLLGTLSTSTLDNGRGKSRLSLLKHRHEIASGVTSSVTGSLIGYHDLESRGKGDVLHYQVINYASGNISSWTDIHSASDPGRLVYLNDSAGHPKFRRTTVRGLVSWAPHWTICCVAADQEGDTTGRAGATASATDILGSSCAEMDLAKAHLKLCLNLGLPLIVVITKLDLASINALKPMLGRILSLLKSAGRRPEILSAPSDEQRNMQTVHRNDELQVRKLLSTVPQGDECEIVPIVLTSAVTGKGVGKLHALLRLLPIPRSPEISQPDEHPTHIEIYAKAVLRSALTRSFVVACVMDRWTSGKKSSSALSRRALAKTTLQLMKYMEQTPIHALKEAPKLPTLGEPFRDHYQEDFSSQYHPTMIMLSLAQSGEGLSSSTTIPTTSIPQHSDRAMDDRVIPPLTSQDRIRKGMVLMSYPGQSMMSSLRAYDGFVALMEPTESLPLHAGDSMIAYIASIRSPVRVTDCRNLPRDLESTLGMGSQISDDREDVCRSGATAGEKYKITCEFSTTQEWFEIGSRVLVMPASGFDSSNPGNDKGEKLSIGLEGFVGRIVQGLG